MIKKLALLFIGFCMIFSVRPSAAQDKDFAPTAVHRAITSESDWLNTSRALTPQDLAGRIILLDFWTFCCINCIHVIPDLQYLEHKFGDNLTVIGVHSAKFQNEKDRENIRSAMLRYGIEHPVVNDSGFQIWQQFAVRSWPTLILIGADGKIAQMYSGEGHRADLERDIEHLIEQYNGKLQTSALPLALEKSKQPATTLQFPGKVTYAEKFGGGDDRLIIGDSGHNRILVTDFDGWIDHTIGGTAAGDKDGSFRAARFSSPQGVLFDETNQILYVADTGNHKLKAVNFKNSTVRTLAGTGKRGGYNIKPASPAAQTALASPWDLAFYPDKNHIAIANAGSHQLLSYDIAKQTVSILAGNGRESIDDGKYPQNSLSQPSGLSVLNGKLYFVDSETSSLRVLENGSVKTLIGTGLFDFGFKDGPQGTGLLQHSLGLQADADGVYIADSYNHSIRFYDFKTQALSTILGDGNRGVLNEPNAVIKIGNRLLIADTNNSRVAWFDSGTNSLAALDVMPRAKPAEFVENATAPNVHSMDLILPAGKKVPVEINLETGWKINHEAPSYLALFRGNGGKFDLVQEWNLAQLKKGGIDLPVLENRGVYRLQGTLYYCQDKEGSICLIKSFDAHIDATNNYVPPEPSNPSKNQGPFQQDKVILDLR
ncbi:MAG: redoxin domain-containing protein [Alphaproteobacteria bacterium]|nr:MAG: redoxin domain-containing protein [Alphaproteobacteria bacterium]